MEHKERAGPVNRLSACDTGVMETIAEQFTGVVLVGGGSSRMGANKALIRFGGEKLLDRVVVRMQEAFARLILITNDPDKYNYLGLPVIGDIYPGRGPLSGIHAGLCAASTPYIFVVACDMPFVDPKLALYLARQAPGFDVVVVRDGPYLEPLFAVYGRGCLEPIESILRRGLRARVVDFFPAVRVKYIERGNLSDFAGVDKVFMNINTPQDLERALQFLE
ncbi:molybdenum cofactor guanylyltransferase [Desulfofundulus thermosubterraneus]|uniref:Probable molybdenum cofactor guanylyltransferase n=1 Tax=Desulfofundulus thermosubterraneus DSM 16057 TaxID=1121432 RepID=A0A1M6GET4_9FIRM|nr:molybdenum cofactor guanylyltransferase [Desulfofundulus thermosubterraneus]SHJ08474.1 molybdenum cofactor guanylyltransferase [Desulfofundulus thermosubterraneus DSM 16057]